MSKLLLSSDLHLGHKNIFKFRTQFATAEEHHETVFENLATSVNKRDSLILLGDVGSSEWLARIRDIKCQKKSIVLGNHDLEWASIADIYVTFDSIYGLYSKKNCWFSHCPIHPSEFRKKRLNIHGHLHDSVIDDERYVNVCLEHTDYKPIDLQELL